MDRIFIGSTPVSRLEGVATHREVDLATMAENKDIFSHTTIRNREEKRTFRERTRSRTSSKETL